MSNIIDRCTLRKKIETMHIVRSHVGRTRQTLDHMQPFELQPPIKYSSLEINLQKDTDTEQNREYLCVRHLDLLRSFALSCHLNARVTTVRFY